MHRRHQRRPEHPAVSVLFSEPKIPQLCASSCNCVTTMVSVLFSEPKIPQFEDAFRLANALVGFSALQRAENSSMRRVLNILTHLFKVSVLFSEPKIPQ